MQKPCGGRELGGLQELKKWPGCLEHNCPCREELETGFLKMAGPPAMLSYQDSLSPGLQLR